MKDWSQVIKILNEQKIPNDDQGLVKDFLNHFSFRKRQQLMGIFLGFPEKIQFFIELLKKKRNLAENPAENSTAEILDLENREIDLLIKEIQQ